MTSLREYLEQKLERKITPLSVRKRINSILNIIPENRILREIDIERFTLDVVKDDENGRISNEVYSYYASRGYKLKGIKEDPTSQFSYTVSFRDPNNEGYDVRLSGIRSIDITVAQLRIS